MNSYLRPLAELIVDFGANLQPGQIVSVQSEPGKEELARTVADVAYQRGAKFVDLNVFDVYFKRSRLEHADPETVSFVPPWHGQRLLALGEHHAARIGLTGPVAPRLLEGIDPALVGRDRFPRLAESGKLLTEQTTNWTIAPAPTRDWAELVYPELEPAEALEGLWEDVAVVCRLDQPDPIAAWQSRMNQLAEASAKLDELQLDELHFEGPGTSLTVGLFPTSRWVSGSMTTVDGIVHHPNLPTEEVFTTPDPERVDGTVTSTKPLYVSGAMVEGLRVRFEHGRAVEIDADRGADTLRVLTQSDAGAARLGEVALVDRESGVGALDTVFYSTLLDENAASHVALGQGLTFAVEDQDDLARVNESAIHVDFMIGSDQVEVSGTIRDGRRVALLRGGRWQM